MSGISIYAEATISKDLIQLFRKKYERFILEIMNRSEIVFPGQYEQAVEQAHGECDYVESETGKKFDAKLPFRSNQVELLTNGKKHAPRIEEWISEMQREACQFDVIGIRNNTYDVTKTDLYSIIYHEVTKDKEDENIILFLPFPIGTGLRGNVFTLCATDYLSCIFGKMKEEVNFSDRTIYAIYPIHERNIFAVRNLKTYGREYVECKGLGKYFTYTVTGYEVK